MARIRWDWKLALPPVECASKKLDIIFAHTSNTSNPLPFPWDHTYCCGCIALHKIALCNPHMLFSNIPIHELLMKGKHVKDANRAGQLIKDTPISTNTLSSRHQELWGTMHICLPAQKQCWTPHWGFVLQREPPTQNMVFWNITCQSWAKQTTRRM